MLPNVAHKALILQQYRAEVTRCMASSLQSERLYVDGPVGRLEGVLEQPGDESPVAACLVLHPHPQYGGTLENKVAHTLARTFVRTGCAALRINFRGTGASDGEFDGGDGETLDAGAALAYLGERFVDTPLWVAGFSFGAAIAIRLAASNPVAGLVSVAPAVRRFASGLERQPDCPWLVVQGDRDELVAVDDTIDWLNTLTPGPELLVVEGAEHFFHGRLNDLREAVAAFIGPRLPSD